MFIPNDLGDDAEYFMFYEATPENAQFNKKINLK